MSIDWLGRVNGVASVNTSMIRLFNFRWYQGLVLLHDFSMCCLALILGFALRYGIGGLGAEQYTIMYIGAPLYALMFVSISTMLGVNGRLWRYVTLDDLTRLLVAATASVFAAMLAMFLVSRLGGVPRSTPLIIWLLTLVLVCGPRFVVRAFMESKLFGRNQDDTDRISVPVLLVGTGQKASMFIRWARSGGFAPYRPVAVLDVDGKSLGRLIEGIPILGPLGSLTDHLKSFDKRGEKPTWIIVCDNPKADVMAELAQIGKEANVKVSKLPSLTTLQDTAAERSVELRPIALEDLLGRPQIKLDMDAIKSLLIGRRVMVTGGGGTIGSELCRQIIRHRPQELMILDSSEFNLYAIEHELKALGTKTRIIPMMNDIRNRSVIFRKFKEYSPELVFHAAALKHVPMVEANPIEGIATNVFGTRNVVDASLECGVLGMVQVSSDKAVNPTNVMGASKRLAEMYLQTKDLSLEEHGDSRFMTVRFGNVLGSSGSVVPLFRKQLATGGPLTITHPDITRYFMTVHEATQLVLQASAHCLGNMDELGQIMVLDMGQPMKVYDLATHMVRLAGLEPGRDIEIKTVGLRPGEKLYEELFATDEQRLASKVDGINVARSKAPEAEVYHQALERLHAAVLDYDEVTALSIVSELIPNFERFEEKTSSVA